MRIILDSVGYAHNIDISSELDHRFPHPQDINQLELSDFFNFIKPLMDYWKELESWHMDYINGEMPKEEYKKKVLELIKKYKLNKKYAMGIDLTFFDDSFKDD